MSNSTPSSPRNSIAVTEPSSPGTIEKGELHSRKSKKIVSPQRLSKNRKSTSTSHNNNAFIKYGSLLLLVGQMVGCNRNYGTSCGRINSGSGREVCRQCPQGICNFL